MNYSASWSAGHAGRSKDPAQELEAEGPQSDPLREEIRLAQIELYKHPFWSPEYTEGYKRVDQIAGAGRKQRRERGAGAVPARPACPTDRRSRHLPQQRKTS